VPDKPEVARELLEDARELFKAPVDRGTIAERRATTLQGAVAIAATFTLAAGTIVAEKDKIPSHTWRVVFAVLVALVVLAFVGAGILALQATSRIEAWRDADDEAGFGTRARLDVAEARMARAHELLVAYGENEALATWKIERAHLAAVWFRSALGLLVALAAAFVVYAATT